ncbi:aspartyl protease family protein [Pedobacter frigiditerrae]|uniref:aspartyl protease family protein n=1 Tax=Pedobacter frigiditerrae TaxID=2530452 RepID=UPI00292CD76C|nr:aspartyl protease family protein [Pedobacter frigiditerrae]
MKKYIYLLTFSLFFFSCGSTKRVLESGNIKETSFTEKIPFTFNYGVPIINVSINGKTYNFLFDTGAATVISPELMTVLNLKAATKDKTFDSQGNAKEQDFVVIPSMKIGNLNFENIGAVVIDVKNIFEFKCMNYDGIIGANQMAKAIWQIDYKNKMLTATNSLSNLNISTNTQALDFKSKGYQKTPIVAVKIGNKTSYVTFDTGATTDFNFAINNYKTELTNFKEVQTIGNTGTGIYGGSKNSATSYFKIPSFNIGSILLKNQIPAFTESASNLIGNTFFKNYKIIIDWNTNKIYMANEVELTDAKLENFGIGFRYINNKPIIAKIFKNSEAEKIGIKLNDQVIAIDGKDSNNFTEEEACNYAFNNILKGKTETLITILRDGKKLDFKLKRAALIE